MLVYLQSVHNLGPYAQIGASIALMNFMDRWKNLVTMSWILTLASLQIRTLLKLAGKLSTIPVVVLDSVLFLFSAIA